MTWPSPFWGACLDFTQVNIKESKTRVRANSQNRGCLGFSQKSKRQKRVKNKKPTLDFAERPETDSGFCRPSLLYIPTQPFSYFITCFLFFCKIFCLVPIAMIFSIRLWLLSEIQVFFVTNQSCRFSLLQIGYDFVDAIL